MRCFLYLLLFTFSLSAEPVDIKIVGNDWGKADKGDLKKVLKSAAFTILKHCPDVKLPPIQVGNSMESPISLFKRAPNGDLQVKLTSKDLFWAQHAYQFAHEVGHCLCRFKRGDKANMWFEESICETASLFSLRAMAKEWKVNPSYPNWKGYSKTLFNYAENLLKDPERSLPKNKTLGEWYQEHKDHLVKNWTDRKKNAVVAKELLPLLERDPKQWQAFFWINEKRTSEKVSFKKYLNNWESSVPDKHKPFVRQIRKMFSLEGK